MKKLLFAALATIFLVSCIGRPDLKGKWRIIAVDEDDISQMAINPFIKFDKATGSFHGNSGVNIINGTYVVTGSRINFDNISTTMMAGPEDDMEVEREILESIKSATKFRGKNSNVEILDDDGDVVLVLTR